MTTKLRESRKARCLQRRRAARYPYLLALVLCLFGASASAQTTPPGGIAPPSRPERPYRGLFGGGVGNTVQSLTFEGKVGGGFVENPLAEQGFAAARDPSTGGGASGLGTAKLTYSMYRTRWGASADHMTLLDYYPQLGQNSVQDRHVMTANVYFMPAKSTRVAFVQNFKNFPEVSYSDLFDPQLEQGVLVNQDLGLSQVRYTRYGSSVEVTQKLSNRSRVNATLGYAHGKVESREWIILTGSANLTHSISKGIALSLGYQEGGQRDVNPGAVQEPRNRQPRIQAGIDINQPLSISRRTKVAFSTGLAGTQDRSLKQTTYHLIGAARVNREFGQTWVAGLTYNRGVRQLEPIGVALFSDSLTFLVQGSFSKRVQFQSHVGISNGRVGSTGRLENQVGSMQVSVALTKQLAFETDYADYRYSATSGDLPPEAIGQRNSRSLRMSLQVWLPLISRTKKP